MQDLLMNLLCAKAGQLHTLYVADVHFGEPEFRFVGKGMPALRSLCTGSSLQHERRYKDQLDAARVQLQVSTSVKCRPLTVTHWSISYNMLAFFSPRPLYSLSVTVWDYLLAWWHLSHQRYPTALCNDIASLTLRDLSENSTIAALAYAPLHIILKSLTNLTELILLTEWVACVGSELLEKGNFTYPATLAEALYGLHLTRLHLEPVWCGDTPRDQLGRLLALVPELAMALPHLVALDMRMDLGIFALVVWSTCGYRSDKVFRNLLVGFRNLKHFGSNFCITREPLYHESHPVRAVYLSGLQGGLNSSAMEEDTNGGDGCLCSICVRSAHEAGQDLLLTTACELAIGCPTLQSIALLAAQEQPKAAESRLQAMVQVALFPRETGHSMKFLPSWHSWPLDQNLVKYLVTPF